MRVRLLSAAAVELREAVNFYNEKRRGLGFRFSDEVKSTIKRVLQHPAAWSKLSENTRHCRVRGFPYSLIYSVDHEDLIIIAVMHDRREPLHWKSRLG